MAYRNNLRGVAMQLLCKSLHTGGETDGGHHCCLKSALNPYQDSK